MALINCPECNGAISTTAPKCPHCGIALMEKSSRNCEMQSRGSAAIDSQATLPSPEVQKKANASDMSLFIGFICIVLMLLVIFISISSNDADDVARRKLTESSMENIRLGLERYRLQFGEYPEPSSTSHYGVYSGVQNVPEDAAMMLYQALTGDGMSCIKLGNQGYSASDGLLDPQEQKNAIIPILPLMVMKGSHGWMFVDGYGRPFQYQKASNAKLPNLDSKAFNDSFELWSLGKSQGNYGSTAASTPSPEKQPSPPILRPNDQLIIDDYLKRPIDIN